MLENIEQVAESLKLFEKTYESMRLVDPVKKHVLTLHQGTVRDTESNCFLLWGKEKVCENCISLRAYVDNQTYVKKEYSKDKIYMVTAIPIELDDRRVVAELLKDATNSLIFETNGVAGSAKSELHTIIDNMNNLTMRDALTGTYNRRFLSEKLPVDLVSTALAEKSLSVIMADIDHFKNVNDTYGHLTGDSILKYFSGTLLSCIRRDSDWVARFGGEEFLICLPGASLEKAHEIAEHMRSSVEQAEYLCGEHTIKITASFGICSVKPRQGDSTDAIIDAADKKLYQAKNSGRNRVEY